MSTKDPRVFALFQERAFRGANRAFLFLLLGVAIGGAGIVLGHQSPSLWFVEVPLEIAGIGLLAVGVILQVQLGVRRVWDTVGVTRELRARVAPSQPCDPIPRAGVQGNVVLSPTFGRRGSGYSLLLLGLALLGILGVTAGALDLAIQPANRSVSSILFLLLFALLVPALLVLGDLMRPIPGFLSDSPSRAVWFTDSGIEGPFYPFRAYQPEGGMVVIRSTWFKLVRARLAAPNRIPWKLLRVYTMRTGDGPNGGTAYISLGRALLPVGFGGLQLTDGVLPSGSSGDSRLGSGLVVSLRKEDLARVLWSASRGGSRLAAVFDQLSPLGQTAVLSARIDGNSRLSRPLSGPWYVWLPLPTSEAQLATWLP